MNNEFIDGIDTLEEMCKLFGDAGGQSEENNSNDFDFDLIYKASQINENKNEDYKIASPKRLATEERYAEINTETKEIKIIEKFLNKKRFRKKFKKFPKKNWYEKFCTKKIETQAFKK